MLYKALARDQQDRYEEMYALRKALESISDGELITTMPLPTSASQPEAKDRFVSEPKPKPKSKPEPEITPEPVRSINSEGETRDMIDTVTEVCAVPANGRIEKNRSQPNWVLWGGMGVAVLIARRKGEWQTYCQQYATSLDDTL